MDLDELHELVMLLKNGLANGRIKISDASLITRINNVRFREDGRVDPDTVDSTVRAAARAFAIGEMRREVQNVKLKDIASDYFDILDQFFGKPFSEMIENHVTPSQIAEHVASNEKIVRAFKAELQEFTDGIFEFWGVYASVVEKRIKDISGLKSVFGGDIFPSHSSNIACSVGLYVDTLILPDPLLRLLTFAAFMEPREGCRLVTKHALSALGYRELALADVDPPIVVIAPDPMLLEDSYKSALELTSQKDVVEHSSIAFGREIPDFDQLSSYLGGFKNIHDLASDLAEPNRVLFDTEWTGTLPEQFAQYLKDTESKFSTGLDKSVGQVIYRAFFGRMMQTNDLLFRSSRYQGTPLIDAPTSWKYLLWKYEYDSASSGVPSSGIRDMIISKAISTAGGTEFGMLSGMPKDALVELRKNGALGSLRETLRSGIAELDVASSDLKNVADAVIKNLDSAFEEHEKELSHISSGRRKFYGLDVSRWIVGGGLSVAAALTHNLGLSVIAAAVPSLLGAPSAPDLKKKWTELRSQNAELKRTSTAILFKHLGHKFGFKRK